MSNIPERLKEPKILRWLAAQRQLYDEEKRAISIWITITLLIALAGTGLAGTLENFTPWFVFLSVLVVVAEIIILPKLEQKRDLAARIQEMIDCELFQLPWNDALAPRPDNDLHHIIDDAVQRFEKRKHLDQEWEELRTWYESPALPDLPLHQARVVCQLENVRWDSRQRRAWMKVVLALGAAVVMAIIGIGLAMNWRFQDFFGIAMLLSLPVLMLMIEHVRAHAKAAERLDYLKIVGRALCHDAGKMTKEQEEEILLRTRELQSEIYHHRKDDVPVFSWFYGIRKSKNKLASTKDVDPCLL